MKMENKKSYYHYIYAGPVYSFNEVLRYYWEGETWALSDAKALNNIIHTFKKEELHKKDTYNIELDPACLDVVDGPLLPPEERCPKCGIRLTDGGYCPKCDDGEEEYSEDEDSLGEAYPEPKKLYSIEDKKAIWDNDAQDYIWWDSESKYHDAYATCYKCKMSPKDFLDLTTSRGADNITKGDSLGFGKLRDLNIDEFNKERRQPIFLIISFEESLIRHSPDFYTKHFEADVVGHEGRHRMFALMQAGVEEVDVQLKVQGCFYDKYKPYQIKTLDLIGQFNQNVKVTIHNPIVMSWEKHKEVNPGLKEDAQTTKSVEESIEKHDTLNPKLWNADNTLKEEVAEKIKEIVKLFTDELEEDNIHFKVKDVRIVGSNCSYNYTKDSDLDVHIIMDSSSLNCPDNLYPLLYSAYRSLFNKNLDVDFYGIPVELYVEME